MSRANSRKICFLLMQNYLETAKDEEDEIITKTAKRKRKPTSKLYSNRREEGVYNILIKKHLIDDGEKFKEFFRVTPDQFAFILSLIEEKLVSTSYNRVLKPISPAEKLALTLRFLATGESFNSLRFSHRISVPAISVLIPKVLKALEDVLIHKFLPSHDAIDWEKKAKEFWARWSFPNAVAAVDGKHVRIVAPDQTGSLYYNYKGYFSIVLLAMVDAQYKFLIVDIGSYGKEGDAGIFNKSDMGKVIKSEAIFPPPQLLPHSNLLAPHVILGDEAFRLDEHIMKPFCKKQMLEDPRKRVFNYQLSKARRVSENAFGIMCSVFRIFFTPINLKPSTVDSVIKVCCCLHNFLRDDFRSQAASHINVPESYELPRENMVSFSRSGGYTKAEGFTIRKMFMDYFNGPDFKSQCD